MRLSWLLLRQERPTTALLAAWAQQLAEVDTAPPAVNRGHELAGRRERQRADLERDAMNRLQSRLGELRPTGRVASVVHRHDWIRKRV